MLHILWWILKIIGIILLVLLVFLLTALLAGVFVPVRYRIEGNYIGEPDVWISATWLARFLSFMFQFHEGEVRVRLRVFGFQLFPRKPKKKAEKRKRFQKKHLKSASRKKNAIERGTLAGEKQKEKRKNEEDRQPLDENPEMEQSISKPPAAVQTSSESEEKSEESQKKVASDEAGFIEKIQKKVSAFFERIYTTWKNVINLIEDLLKKRESILTFLRDESHHTVFLKLKKEVWVLIKHIKPQKLTIRLKFGFDDPAYTGICLGVLSILYSIYQNTIVIEPDFERPVLEAEWDAKGRIRMFKFLCILWRLYRQKECRELFREIRRGNK